ncbi:MAG: serine/threonine protein kinase [Desulfobacula sp.]|nr:serine/threonine protein kinase [Desulfobacula sp.]
MEFKSKSNIVYKTEERPFKIGSSALIWKCIAPHENLCIKEFRLGHLKKVSPEFLTELERLSDIEHPNILKIKDYGDLTDNPAPFILFEFCDGNLREIMQKHDFLTEKIGLQILNQIASALNYLHEMGTIHGDIKPENILFKGNNLYLLSDFGYSKHIGFDETLTMIIQPGETTGTTVYLSPEQLKDNKQTQLSDIYSLAFVAYELFTGHMPIDTKVSIYQQIQQKIEEKIVDPLKYNPHLKLSIQSGILKNLNSIPEKRSKTAMQFMNELNGIETNKKSDSQKKVEKKKKTNWWSKLSDSNKVIIIVGAIAAVATIIAALIG